MIRKLNVTMLGTLPPQKALTPYCMGLAAALDERVRLFFHSFSRIYPAWLHPTKEIPTDLTFAEIQTLHTTIMTRLTWYNPISWIMAGITMKTDIFHSQWWSLPTIPALLFMIIFARLKKIPVVVTVHNVDSHETSSMFYLASRLIFHFSDHLIVHTGINKHTLIQKYHIQSDCISVIPHGSLTIFKTGIKNFRQTRQIKHNEKIVLFFGAIRPYKGLDILLEAFSIVKKSLPARLVIAGSLWESWDRYDQIIRNHGLQDDIINVTGYVPADQVGALFFAADLVVLPYKHFDSQSGVGAAAIAFKVPMIVTDTGGLPELVKDSACVVPCSNPEKLALQMIAILSDDTLREKLKNDAEMIEKQMSWETIAEQTVSLYHRILESKRQ